MSDSDLTLKQFFSLKPEEWSSERLSALASKDKISSLKEMAEKEAKGAKWPVAFAEILKRVDDLLDISLPDILAGAYNKYRILRQYAEKGKYSPDETFLVPLADHTIKSEHHPYLEVFINENLVAKIDFTIMVALKLNGIILKIQDGRIKEIFTGTCQGKGAIECEGLVLVEKEMPSVSLPGSINLGEGIPIAP